MVSKVIENARMQKHLLGIILDDDKFLAANVIEKFTAARISQSSGSGLASGEGLTSRS